MVELFAYQNVAFVSALPVAHSSLTIPALSQLRPAHPMYAFRRPGAAATPVRPPAVTKAILDTPASNTYLQRHAEVAVRDFLTRRAVDTVMYYLAELSDRPTHAWLSRFDNFSARVRAHKFENGDHFIKNMVNAPTENGVIKIGHPSGRFSRSFAFTIEPRKIARRIMDVRLHLAQEWARDLRCVAPENLELQRLSFERLVAQSDAELDSKRNLIFDCDPTDGDQSPLRFKNYIALKTLITQHAVMRLLPFMRDQGPNHEYMYLLQFVNRYGPIGDGDDFVRALMAGPAQQRSNPTFTVVPRTIAAQVLEVREALANEWISVMEFVPIEEKLLTRGMLEKSMEASHDIPE